VEAFAPDVMVFDSRWPADLPSRLAKRGVKRVLVLRAHSMERMRAAAIRAKRDFDRVLLPHAQDELGYYYGEDAALLKTLSGPPFLATGPVARTREATAVSPSVIFSLGAGAPYLVPVAADDDVQTQIGVFVRASELLHAAGFRNLQLIAGPYLKIPTDLGPLALVHTAAAFEMLGPQSCVVSRGGYNTCWEAIGAQSHLIVSSDQRLVEDVEARMRYLVGQGFARGSKMNAQAIAEAVSQGHAPNVERGHELVNRDISLAVHAIL